MSIKREGQAVDPAVLLGSYKAIRLGDVLLILHIDLNSKKFTGRAFISEF